jgi:hypothetical protein
MQNTIIQQTGAEMFKSSYIFIILYMIFLGCGGGQSRQSGDNESTNAETSADSDTVSESIDDDLTSTDSAKTEGAADNASGDQTKLRFDGYYISNEEPLASYLRFYEDGSVIWIMSHEDPEEIASWFTKDSEGVGTGLYSILGAVYISFSISDNTITVDYQGKVVANGLELEGYNRRNGVQFTENYNFVQIQF